MYGGTACRSVEGGIVKEEFYIVSAQARTE